MADDSLLSAEQKFALIDEVRDHPMLYDKQHDDYHNTERKNRVWAKIAEKEGINLDSGKEAKDSWDRLRTLFKRNHNKKSASGSSAAKAPKWQFYASMAFLETHSEPRAESQSTLQLTAGPPSSSSSEEKSQETEKVRKDCQCQCPDSSYESLEAQKSVFRTPTAPKNRKRSSEQGVDEWFADAIKRLEEKASRPKSRNQSFADMLANDLDDFPEHVQPALRNELMQLVHTRRTQYCYNGSPSASPFSASSPASTSTVTNYILDQPYTPSQVLFTDP